MICRMKRIVKAWAVLMAAVTAMTACQKEQEVPVSDYVDFSIGECEMTASDDPETRTYFTTPSGTTVPTLWTGGEPVSVFYQARSGSSGVVECTAKASSDHKTAKLASSKPIPTASLRTVFFMMVSPTTVVASGATPGNITVTVPESQTPNTSTPDENAMILGARTATSSLPPASVTFSPKHMTAYMCLKLTNASSVGTVQSVTVTATTPLSGSATFNGSTNPTITAASSGTSNSVTAMTRSLNSVWLACLPATVEGTTLTIKVTGKKGDLTRKITVPSGKNLEAGKIALLTVDMNPMVAVTGVTVSPTTLDLTVGETSTLTATVTPSNASVKTVTWSSSNTAVATVSSTGVVTGVAAGSATITATTTSGGKTATCAVTVKAATVPVTGVTLNKTTLTLGVGKTSTLTATVTPSNATDKSVTWTSSNTAVATVTSAGVVKGVKAGSATITVKTNDGGYTAKCTVTVNKTPTKVVINKNFEDDFRFDLDDAAYHTSVGQTNTITYTVYYSDGSTEYCLNGTPSVVSGSGVTVSGSNAVSMTCTQAGKEAIVRVAAKNDASVYDEIQVKTWDAATSIELKCDAYDNWVKSGSYTFVYATVKPSTARQKVLVRSKSVDTWDILQTQALTLKLTAPSIEDKSSYYSQFRNNDLTLTVTTGAGDLFVSKTYSVTNLDLKEPKPLDWICYNSSTNKFKILDGGLRLYWMGAPSGAVYTKTPTLSVPSGYSVVGVVTHRYVQDAPPGTNCASAFPVVEKVDGTTMELNKFHGFAIALYNASDGCIWSTDHDNVDGNENWRSEIGKSTVADSQNYGYNALGLSIASYYYNYCRGSSHDIHPVFAIQDYWTRFPLNTYHFSIPAIDWGVDFGSWVVPTQSNFWPLLSSTGKLSDSQMMTLFNARINAAGGTLLVSDDYGYWTIQQYDADEAAMIWAGGLDRRKKDAGCRVRAFLVF